SLPRCQELFSGTRLRWGRRVQMKGRPSNRRPTPRRKVMGRHVLALMAATVWLVIPSLAQSQQQYGDKEHAELAQAMTSANVSLERGLAASASAGTPISAKFEVEDGTFQLSVYTMQSGKPSEVIVDHKTGKVAKAEPISSGDDLTKAKEQGAAMGKA